MEINQENKENMLLTVGTRLGSPPSGILYLHVFYKK